MDDRSFVSPPALNRSIWAAAGLGAVAVIAIARWLEPDPSGTGTHQQLGLPPCGFLYWTRLPCPTCGLTTAFAHMARLQLTEAFAAHRIGPLLFALTVCVVPLAAFGFGTARAPADAIERLRLGRLTAIIAAALFLSWFFRLAAILFF